MADEETVIHREVPDELHKLVRLIVRGFYGIEHGLVVDVLVRNACVKEEDIQELLKLDKKHLRAMLVTLKNDKLLKTKLCCVETEEGKVLRHNYYYINYRSVCNIIKYKLHHILKKIETQERDLSNRAAFKCPLCHNTYTDLDVNYLMDPITGTLQCTYCHSEVEEDVSNEDGKDSRTSQARFNEQMDPVYRRLREVENIRLSLEVLEPEPMVIPHLHPDAKQNVPRPRPSGTKQGGTGHWTDRKGLEMDYDQEVTINIGDDQHTDKVAHKETPIWIQKSTVKSKDEPSTSANFAVGASLVKDERSSPKVSNDSQNNDEVFAMLLMQEGGSNSRSTNPTTSRQYNNGTRSNVSDGEDEAADDDEDDDDDDFEEVDDSDPIVMVAGKSYPYSEVANQGQSLIQLMSHEEKQAYIKIGQQMYDDMDH